MDALKKDEQGVDNTNWVHCLNWLEYLHLKEKEIARQHKKNNK